MKEKNFFEEVWKLYEQNKIGLVRGREEQDHSLYKREGLGYMTLIFY
jgi:hypothetical protein